jgi:pimeloyl-ACP methyl ester carboxylesterase
VTKAVSWNSQPIDEWRRRYASGKFIDLGGHITHYVEKGQGPTVILLHGWFHDSQMWSRNIVALSKSAKVYAVDLWGFGYSTRETLDWGYPLYSEQLSKFMDALNINKASLVGQSMGGGTAILFCTQHRERVNKLVLVTSGGMPNPPLLMTRITCMPHVGEFLFRLRGSRRGILKRVFIRDEKSIVGGYFEELTRFHKIRGTNETLLSSLRKNFFDKLLPEIKQLGEMKVPTLIIWGQHDRSIKLELGQEIHKILKDSQLEVLKESAHCPNYEQPGEFNKAVIDFLKRQRI